MARHPRPDRPKSQERDGGHCADPDVHTELHALLDRFEPARPRHPARLVGEAIEILGHAHDSLRNGRCRRTVRDARRMLVNMLETAYGGRTTTTTSSGGNSSGGNSSSSGGGGGQRANTHGGGQK